MSIDKTLARPRAVKDPEAQARATFEAFDTLPDAALIEVRVVAFVLGKSQPTIWRYLREGLIPNPVRIGRATLWRVRDLRAFLDGLPLDMREVA